MNPLVTINDANFNARNVQENFRRVGRLLGLDGFAAGLEVLALLIGGQPFEVELATGSDTEVAHGLQRVPSMVVLGAALDSTGLVKGAPAGGLSGSGGNDAPWTETAVFLRATVAGTYAVVLL